MQIKSLEKKLKAYAEKEVPRAAVTALNKVAKPAATEVAKSVASKQNIPAKLIRQQVVFNKATFNRRAAFIRSFTRGINVARLLSPAAIAKKMATGTSKRGVTAKGRLFAGAFINRTRRNGNVFVFEKRNKNQRMPIDVVRIPIDEALLELQLPIASRRFKELFEKYYLHELQFRISKYAQ
jgi:hypothetical protein